MFVISDVAVSNVTVCRLKDTESIPVQNLRSATTLSTFRGANGAELCITEVH